MVNDTVMNNTKISYCPPEAVCVWLTTEQSVLQASGLGTNEGFGDYPTEYLLE